MKLYSLNDGNQDKVRYAPRLPLSWFDQLNARYRWNRFDEYDNRVYQYMYQLLDPAIKNSRLKTFGRLWERFSRPQKVLQVLLTFDAQTRNGGVYQFLFNFPGLAIAAMEAFQEIKDLRLITDYSKVLDEAASGHLELADRHEAFADDAQPFAARWQAFSSGYEAMGTSGTIEDYFYTKKFQKEHFRRIGDYVDENRTLFIHSME